MSAAYRIFESDDKGEKRWIAAVEEQAAQAAAQKRGWTKPAEITPSICIPQDRQGLTNMGCDVIVAKPRSDS